MDPQETKRKLTSKAQGPEAFGPGASPGLYLGVPESDYHDHPAISRSILAEAARMSPLHALYSLESSEDEEESSESMDLGTAAHARVLQPRVFEDRYDVAADRCEGIKGDGDQCSNSAKVRHDGSWYCGVHAPSGDPDDIEVLKSSHYHSAEGIAQATEQDPDAAPLLHGLPGLEEATILWEDPETGLRLRARPDRVTCLPDGDVALVDLKTTRSAHPQDFRRKYARNGYWLQPAFYGAAAASIGAQPVDFVFVVVESSRPYAVQCYRPDSDDRAGAGRRMDGLLSEMSEALDSGAHAYSDGIDTLSLRRYQKDRLSIA